MEHKIIDGGEIFLPFARSRIKALRATGLRYASQQFEIDGVGIKVRIAGEHEYISLGGGSLNVLSGVTKDARVIDLPIVPPATTAEKTLRAFKPTSEAWEYIQRSDPEKSPTVFNDEDRFGFTTDQYGDTAPVSGSMFSGLMAKAVQLLLGVGKTSGQPNGLEVPYSYSFAKTHGIVTASDGKLWLVEISLTNGVIAVPFEVKKGGSNNSTQKMVKEAFKWFKGLPAGKTFPAQGLIAAAIAEGSVIRLATPANLDPFYHKGAYASWVGWAFNNLGSEAHNTCWDSVGGNTTSYHYKLAISIGGTVSPREPNQPKAVGSAILTMESSGVVWEYYRFAKTSNDYLYPKPYGFGNPYTGVCGATPAGLKSFDGAWKKPDNSPIVTRFPVFACFINDVLDVVYINSDLEVTYSAAGYDANGQLVGTNTYTVKGYYVDSTTFPGSPAVTSITYSPYDPSGGSGYTTKSVSNTGGIATNLSTSVIFPGGSRNSYLHFCAGDFTSSSAGQVWTPPVITVVLSSGKKYTQGQTGWSATLRTAGYSYNAKWDIDDYGWCNPGFTSAVGYVVHSVFEAISTGAAPETHAIFSRSVGNPELVTDGLPETGLVLKGTETAIEVSPSQYKYNYLGYV